MIVNSCVYQKLSQCSEGDSKENNPTRGRRKVRVCERSAVESRFEMAVIEWNTESCFSVMTTPRVPAERQIMPEIKMCSVGLEGWKIVSRFNYILFRFFRPARRTISHPIHSEPTPPSTTTTFFAFESFLCFSFFSVSTRMKIT